MFKGITSHSPGYMRGNEVPYKVSTTNLVHVYVLYMCTVVLTCVHEQDQCNSIGLLDILLNFSKPGTLGTDESGLINEVCHDYIHGIWDSNVCPAY